MRYIHHLKKQRIQKENQRGFTVLETIIAIAIVGLSIGGVTTAVRSGISGATLAKEQVQAFYLAQEAIEIIRNKRDSNILNNIYGTATNWLAGITQSGDPCQFGSTCYIDGTGPDDPSLPGSQALFFYSCSGSWGSCPVLRQNGSSGNNAYLYGYDGSWRATQFRREVQIEPIQRNSNAVYVTVRISWTHGALTREFKSKTLLTNWL